MQRHAMGVFQRRKQGRIFQYHLSPAPPSLEPLREAIFFASEQAPVGVIGSYLLRRGADVPAYIRFRHHYFVNALDDGVMYQLLEAMQSRRAVRITTDQDWEHPLTVWPLRIYMSRRNPARLYWAYIWPWSAALLYQ